MNKHGGYYGKQKDMIDFSVNLNPLGLPEGARAWMKEQSHLLEYYPEPSSLKARETIANELLLSRDQVIMGNGASELIYLFARRIHAKKVLLIQPTFNEYERAFKQQGTLCDYHYLEKDNNFSLDDEALLMEIRANRPDVVVICNPNNPTGSYVEIERLEKLLATLADYSAYLLVDESFSDFEDKPTAISLLDNPHLFLIRSMTKFYAIPGIRLGYGLGHSTLIHQLYEYKEPWTINAFASDILPYLIKDLDYKTQTKEWYNREKAYMEKQLKKIDFLKLIPSCTNFFLCHTSIPGKELMVLLVECGVYIRTCEDFIGLEDQYIRLALRTRPENDALIKALKDISLQMF